MKNTGLKFGGYSSKKYREDPAGKQRFAGDIFQDVFGEEGWNEDFLATNDLELNVDRDPALDYVAAKAAEAEYEKEMEEMKNG